MSRYRAKKRLGQNFLVNEEVVARILDLIDAGTRDTVVEIGPGRGALTGSLADSAHKLYAVEFDRDLAPRLKDRFAENTNVTILQQDFLKAAPDDFGDGRLYVVGNIPYNITSPVIDWLCEHSSRIEGAVLMVQREVARRICSKPGVKDWSPMAIFVQIAFRAQVAFDVPAEDFDPPPKVHSSVIQMTSVDSPKADLPDNFVEVVRAAFAQRRKLLVNNLVPALISDSEYVESMMGKLGLDRKARAEQVTVEQFVQLARRLQSIDRS